MRLSTRRGVPLPVPSAFAGFRFPTEVIVVAVRWVQGFTPLLIEADRFTRHAPVTVVRR